MKKILFPCILIAAGLFLSACTRPDRSQPAAQPAGNFVEVSGADPRYFQLTNGDPYIPIGLNLIHPSGNHATEESAFQEVETWMKNLSDNGGNYVRIWLSQEFWDIEHAKAGEYDEQKAQRIDKYIALARKYGLRIKMTLEHFRSIAPAESPQAWAMKSVYHTDRGGPLHAVREYITTAAGRQLFIDKLDYYQDRYGADTIFFGWELWNEMNAMRIPADSAFFTWNEQMLREVKNRFPENLAMQSLGSFDSDARRETYRPMMTMPENEIAQIHRYLDLGARLEICHGPVDLGAADAIWELQSYQTGKPLVLAESGAVEPNHTGPSQYYAKDTAGILLHDVLFAPFFAGSAGAGMVWHWGPYVHRNDLWFQFGRFSHAVKGIDPVKEQFEPQFEETDRFRIYRLSGKSTSLWWLRDKGNDWRSELADGIPPQRVTLDPEQLRQLLPERYGWFQYYDPWEDKWSERYPSSAPLEPVNFKRSLVIKIGL